MSVYEYGNLSVFEVVVHGHLENGPPITVPFPDWWPLRDGVYSATRAVIPYPVTADFHMIYRNPDDGQLSRTRWTVGAEVLGPTLLWYEDTSGVSAIMFQLVKDNDIQQVRDDPDNPSPWADLRDVMVAALAKQAVGAGPVEIPLPGRDTMVFTPQELRYSRTSNNDVREPYENHVYGWTFTAEPAVVHEPAVWLVPEGQSTGIKLSRCVDADGNEWSNRDEPAPTFDPLPPPPGTW